MSEVDEKSIINNIYLKKMKKKKRPSFKTYI